MRLMLPYGTEYSRPIGSKPGPKYGLQYVHTAGQSGNRSVNIVALNGSTKDATVDNSIDEIHFNKVCTVVLSCNLYYITNGKFRIYSSVLPTINRHANLDDGGTCAVKVIIHLLKRVTSMHN